MVAKIPQDRTQQSYKNTPKNYMFSNTTLASVVVHLKWYVLTLVIYFLQLSYPDCCSDLEDYEDITADFKEY